MARYPAIDGVPVHASDRILTHILREELGFRGPVLGEGLGLTTMVYKGVARDQKEAGAMAVHAGVDVGISFETAHVKDLIAYVEEGCVPLALVDRAVRRIPQQKYALGLFEKPCVDVERALSGVRRARHRDLALDVAREGIVLLKDEKNLLPLKKDLRSIAVPGANADDARNQLGDYTSITILQEIVTVLRGVKQKAGPSAQATYVKGCDVRGEQVSEIPAAVEAARKADAAIVVVGESRDTHGETKNVASLDLSGRQEDLIKAIHATGTPTAVMLINGRPLSIPWVSDNVPANVEAWLPGEPGGHAVADMLFGDVNPSGYLPVTVARHVGQLPMWYDYKPPKEFRKKMRGHIDMQASPLYEFGYGLSYTRFEYSALRVAPSHILPSGEVVVSLQVKNAGVRPGADVGQLYLRDQVSSVTRPVKELRGSRKVWLDPGASKTVEFRLRPEDLTSLDRELKPVVEPGTFEGMVGASSDDIRLRGRFEVVR